MRPMRANIAASGLLAILSLAAVPSLATFIVTRRHAWPAGWQEPLLGQLTLELVTSRFGMLALVEPRAS